MIDINDEGVFIVGETVGYAVQLKANDAQGHPMIDIRKIVKWQQSGEFAYTRKGIMLSIDNLKRIIGYIDKLTKRSCPHCKELLIKD